MDFDSKKCKEGAEDLPYDDPASPLTKEDWGRIVDSLTYHFEMTDNEDEHLRNMLIVEKINQHFLKD